MGILDISVGATTITLVVIAILIAFLVNVGKVVIQ